MSLIVLAQSSKIFISKFFYIISSVKFNFEIFEKILLDKNILVSYIIYILESFFISTTSFNSSFYLSELNNLSIFLSFSIMSSSLNFFLFIFSIFSITLFVSFSKSKFWSSKLLPIILTLLSSDFF